MNGYAYRICHKENGECKQTDSPEKQPPMPSVTPHAMIISKSKTLFEK